ncbi:MAG: hypothetical protein HeimC3_53580 [Candidatus Heimdallarchaeota archaeon LC_3]|nr:MAG: hypothetical protein HeimC3_53580 [Candidatus Heimdallarchaeota archaeon LC_3]
MLNRIKFSQQYNIFAHHPKCQFFQNHLFKIRDLYFCKGCSMRFLGFIIFILILLINYLYLSNNTLFQFLNNNILYIEAVLVSPTIFQALITFPRNLSNFFRFQLGIGNALLFTYVLFGTDPLIKLILLFSYVLIYKKLNNIRNNKMNSVCINSITTTEFNNILTVVDSFYE